MSDLEIVRQIELLLDVKLNQQKLNKRGFVVFGFASNHADQVTDIGFSGLSLGSHHNFNKVIFLLKQLSELTTLELSTNQISDASLLKQLPQLTKLDISANDISDLSALRHLTQLTVFDVNNNPIQDYSFLSEFTQLTTLELYDEKIIDYSFLSELKQLTTLFLSSNQIIDYSFLNELPELMMLYLRNNQIIDYSFLSELTQLRTLDLSSNQIIDYSFLSELPELTMLYLRNNQIIDYSFLSELTQLTTLDLRYNQIKDISFLIRFTQLTNLYLSNNQIKDVAILRELKQLISLNLSENQISNISILRELNQLTDLDLAANRISDISVLSKLNQLNALYLNSNQISDISALGELTQLKTLFLNSNQIKDVSFLSELKQLRTLYLIDNQISDISFLSELRQLDILELSSNLISLIPLNLLDLELPISLSRYANNGQIILANNPINMPPIEIVKQGNSAVRVYYESISGRETVKVNEVKVLLVGEGMAGKTSLLKRLQGLPFDKKESRTHGVNVVPLEVDQNPELAQVEALQGCQLNCWDFGGQEVMHASHQFFMSERSLYILVLDARAKNNPRMFYWLHHIEKFGDDSPIIVAMNKINTNPDFNLDQETINSRFPSIKNRFYRISCETNQGLTALFREIGRVIPETSMFGSQVSPLWIEVKDVLVQATREKRYLDRQRFAEICVEKGVHKPEEQKGLLKFLNALGIVLYFDRLNIDNIYVIDPHWVTIGVYKIINSHLVANGRFDVSQLPYILNDEVLGSSDRPKYDPAEEQNIVYEPDEQSYILRIMEQFQLIYPLDQKFTTFIIPDRLPDCLETEPEIDEAGMIQFILEYDYLPTSILPRLMIDLKDQVIDGQQWRYGMILQNNLDNNHCQAKVRLNEIQRRIIISVSGPPTLKRNYLYSIRLRLDAIHRDFKNMKIAEYIPLAGGDEVKYGDLLAYEQKGKRTYFSPKLDKDFPVAELLDAVITPEERQASRDFVVGRVSGDFVGEDKINRDKVVFDQVNIYHASPAPYNERTAVSMEPKPKLNDLRAVEEQLDKLNKLKGVCENNARNLLIRKKTWVTVAPLVAGIILLGVLRLTGWNFTEPLTWIVPVAGVMLGFVIAGIKYKHFNLYEGIDETYSAELEKEMAVRGYSADEHGRLKGEKARIEAAIRAQE